MKLDIDFSALEILVSNMGASSVAWTSDVKITQVETTDWVIDLETKGIDVQVEDIEIQRDGLLKYRGKQILLYIKEVNFTLPKFHFYQCATLESMQRKKRFDRYVVTQRKTGYFLMDRKNNYGTYEKDVEVKLDVCKNCLNWFNKNYRKRYGVENFDLVEFFEHFPTSPITQLPTYTDLNAPAAGYTGDWPQVSAKRKADCFYTCQECRLDLSNHKTLLHTHHMNGVKSDNSTNNLKVLCIECHSKQPSHEHIRPRFSNEILEIQRIKLKDPRYAQLLIF